METKTITINGIKTKMMERICDCGQIDYVRYSTEKPTRMCAKCATDLYRHNFGISQAKELPEDEDKNQAMIKKFLSENKKSRTLQDEEIERKERKKLEQVEARNKIKREEAILKEYQENKKTHVNKSTSKYEEREKIPRKKAKKNIEYVRKFKNKKEALYHYTLKLRDVFKDLGIEKKHRLRFTPEPFCIPIDVNIEMFAKRVKVATKATVRERSLFINRLVREIKPQWRVA